MRSRCDYFVITLRKIWGRSAARIEVEVVIWMILNHDLLLARMDIVNGPAIHLSNHTSSLDTSV